MSKNNITYKFLPLIIVLQLFMNCYTFTGSSLSPEIKTIYIDTFPNYSPLQNATLSQDFTIELQDIFNQRTKLDFVEENAHISIEGEIKNYRIAPISVQSGDLAAQNRLTISVAVRYENTIESEKSFDKTYSDYADFEANTPIESVQDQLIEEINERLVIQIFNDIATNW